ncbi:universal stress protein [Pedobacter nanyangensis]|uniref:universal stress protein n=1 Tax=Pedobacter nanyangensis TaxID=1562389 RepID=UPI000DE23813|nr:universal stress protein [Pedobacter nanyangensis]
MRSIIVATNFSPLAENAVNYAAAIAEERQLELVLFNSFTLPLHASNSLLPASSIEEIIDQNLKRLQKRAHDLSEKHGITVFAEQIFYGMQDELPRLIAKYNTALLVFGMSEKSVEQSYMGNTTTAAIKNLDFPIMAVPAGLSYFGIKKVLFACDDLSLVPKTVFDRINEVAQGMGAQVEVFHVEKHLEKMKEMDEKSFSEITRKGEHPGIVYLYKGVLSNNVISEIAKEVAVFGADILIMSPKKYGFWESIVHRSKTRLMAAGLQVPLLSIPI